MFRRKEDIDLSRAAHCVGILFAEPAAEFDVQEDSFIYCAVNTYWEEKEYTLPELPEGFSWEIYCYSGDPEEKLSGSAVNGKVTLMSRSQMVLIGKKG